MKDRILIKNLKDYIGKIVTVKGFVDTIRDQKRMQFLVLRDYTGKAQLLHMKSKVGNDSIGSIVSSLTVESSVVVTGNVVEAPQVKLGGLEIEINSIKVCNLAESPLPITSDSNLDKQIDWRQISLRRSENQLIFRVQTTMEQAMREYWAKNNFIEIHSPKLMGTASESGAELFKVPYFNNLTAYLAQSPQFYKQMAMAAGMDRIFEIAPVFRANPSFTSRHDTEFTSIDMEISWINSHEDVMRMEEEWLVYAITAVAEKHGDEIKEAFGVDVCIPVIPFPRITLAEARAILEKQGHEISHKADLDPQGERMLSEYVAKRYSHEFVFVTDYPASVRAFYHMRDENNHGLTKSFDLLWKGLEITTGAQREHNVDKLISQAKEHGFSIEPLRHYFNFFRYGCPSHGGCGVGLTRLLMVMLDRQNVREVTFLYRGPNRLTP
ncbi:aspartate--tRNA(Asn) ligase [Patescibacteria group bacterium]|nr:aspartate--tRNA(Asn) ligase [Patescibacteria group bacterium]MBU4141487.1 aspartate--tRNA(Asn) ligase [Patescibacteria group bacterium]